MRHAEVQEGNPRSQRAQGRSARAARVRPLRRLGLLAAGAALALAALPAGASAADGPATCDSGVPVNDPNGTATRYTCFFPFSVQGYEVKQTIGYVPHPGTSDSQATISHMDVDIVGDTNPATNDPVPIQRLMLHHIVFINTDETDPTCNGTGYLGFDNRDSFGLNKYAPQRFYAAGEERAKLTLPKGYGYAGGKESHSWPMVYMVMNHKSKLDHAYIQYSYIVSDSPQEPVTPYWFDENNCKADPIYNVPGHGRKRKNDIRAYDFAMPRDGRIVAGAGHVHGGARKLTLTQPDCGNRQVAQSVPTWGYKSNPFYHVRPILHEPGPINMTAFGSETGIPVKAGTRLRLNSIYDNTLPHVRVMGIMVIFVAEGAGHAPVASKCDPLPGDLTNTPRPPGRYKPVKFRIPLTALDANLNTRSVKGPPGRFKRLRSGATITVGDRFFSRPNVVVKSGAKLTWNFKSAELHNLTLANGPLGIGSPNLDGGRNFSKRLNRPGVYRFFCALHPTQMIERVVVKPKHRKHRRHRKA